MLMSRATRLAIEVLADLPHQGWITAEELARGNTGGHAFLQQILNRLVREGIARSKKGRGGGYQFARNPKTLTLKAVIDSIDGRDMERCMLDSTPCDGRRRCRLEPMWHPIRDHLVSFLEAVTIQSIAERSCGAVDRFELSELDG